MLDNPLKVEAFKLKGRLFTLTVLELNAVAPADFFSQLQQVVKQAPKMFSHTPVVLDLTPLKGASFDLRGIIETMASVKMVAVAVQGASVIQQKSAVACGLSVISASSKKDLAHYTEHLSDPQCQQRGKLSDESPALALVKSSVAPVEVKPGSSDTKVDATGRTKIIRSPVRSGQQIVAPEGDLIILASVGHGAEVLAHGNIHVYGSLRGRALAGINGDIDAGIFCQSLEAELVSIAGVFRLSESFAMHANNGAKQIALVDKQISISPL